jgi:hypothetical protein
MLKILVSENALLNNSRFGDFVDRIYPIEFEIKNTTDTDRSASYIDLHLEIDSRGRLRRKLYNKRDDLNGQPSHGVDRKIFEVMTSTLPKGIIGSVASMLAANLYEGHPDRNNKLRNIVSSERDILHMQRVPLVEQELLTLPGHLNPPGF